MRDVDDPRDRMTTAMTTTRDVKATTQPRSSVAGTNPKPMVKRLLTGCLLTASLLFGGVAPADAGPPVEEGPFVDVFDDVNPCTGRVHTVTIAATFSVHSHDGRTVATGKSTVSTSSGFSGKGSSSFVINGQVERGRFLDMLSNGAGDRIRARGVFVFDLSTETVRVDRFALTCLG
jgi:hypothetical protein